MTWVCCDWWSGSVPCLRRYRRAAAPENFSASFIASPARPAPINTRLSSLSLFPLPSSDPLVLLLWFEVSGSLLFLFHPRKSMSTEKVRESHVYMAKLAEQAERYEGERPFFLPHFIYFSYLDFTCKTCSFRSQRWELDKCVFRW